MARRRDKRAEKAIVAERVGILASQAGIAAGMGDSLKAEENVRMALRLSTRYRMHLPAAFRRSICKKCKAFLTGKNSRHHLDTKRRRKVVECLGCGYKTFYPYGRKAVREGSRTPGPKRSSRDSASPLQHKRD
ncbi:hypothetical protein ACFLRF_04075 [Candidatus Altiarchaeota archaeon]